MANRALFSVRTAPEVTLCLFQDPKVPFNDLRVVPRVKYTSETIIKNEKINFDLRKCMISSYLY